MIKFSRKVWLPSVVSIAIYALISIIYFAPQFGGDELIQNDVIQYKGMTQDILESRERTGKDPQWTGSLFGGMPAYMINVAYPSQVIKNSARAITNLIPAPAAFIFFAMLAMWLMLVMMGMNMWVAMVGGVMYGLSTYFFLIIDAGHITKMWALVYAPLMFGGAYISLRGNMWVGGAVLALFTSLQVGANHPQISYYFILAMAAFWISEAIFAYREGVMKLFAKRTAVMVAAGVLAVGSNFAPLWYAYEHTPDTMRGGSVLAEDNHQSSSSGLDLEYATAWSYGRMESFNMLIPDFMGRASSHTFSKDGEVATSLKPYRAEQIAQQIPMYWGTQPFTGGPTYIGAVVLFLAILGFCLSDNRHRWWILGVSIFMLMLSWGNNLLWFTELMFNILPGYNKFRTVSMTLTVLEWTAPLLAAMGLAKIWDGGVDKSLLNRSLAWAGGLTAGVSLLFILLGGTLLSFDEAGAISMLMNSQFPDQLASEVASAMAAERYSLLASDAWRSIVLVVISAAVVWLAMAQKIKRGVMIALLSGLIIFDLVGVGVRFLSYDRFKSPSQNTALRPTAVDRQIWQDKELGYRVFNLTVSPFNDATTSYFHRSVGGYHGAKLSRYQDLIENYLSVQNPEVLDMLNTKYLIVPNQKSGAPEVVARQSANGAAWFVSGVVEANNPHQEMELLGRIKSDSVAVVELSEGVRPKSFGAGEISLVEYEPNRLVYDYTLEEDGVAIFSEIYYNKGWSATIDGKPAPYFRANYLLRAMELPAGSHQVVWEFRAPRWGLTGGVTLVCSLIILISLIAALLYEGRQKIKA